jgi:propanol-preferring alcohol dehydrogenase
MVLEAPQPVGKDPLKLQEVPTPEPGPGQVRIRVEVCGVCRTDLHVVEGELPPHRQPVIPGHQIVGRVEKLGEGVSRLKVGDRAGVAWLHRTDQTCDCCRHGHENLCKSPTFTGYDVDGGFAEFVCAPEEFVYRLQVDLPSANLAPLLCGGIIGYRALRRSDIRPGQRLGLWGFGASAHIVIQIAQYWDCEVYVCSRDPKHRALAEEMGAKWVGTDQDRPPVTLHGAILFAPVGDLVPTILEALDRGGTLAVAGIYLTPIPELDYEKHLFYERSLRSVTANTRRDGEELLRLAGEVPLETHVEEFPLERANEALRRIKGDGISGAAVLRIQQL